MALAHLARGGLSQRLPAVAQQARTAFSALTKLPDLPYDYSALEPAISGQIMELHHSKHHQTYVNAFNAALEKYQAAESKGDIATTIGLQGALKFNGGGHVNHSLFWTSLTPSKDYEPPSGDLSTALEKQFGSVDQMIEKFNPAAAGIQGSGWCWLGYDKSNDTIRIATTANQDPLSTQGLVPLLGVDMWEHAFYLQYKNVKPEYLKNIWQVINWKTVADRFAARCAKGQGPASPKASAVPDQSTNGEPGLSSQPQEEQSLLAKVSSAALLISPFFFWGTSMVVMKELSPHTTPMFVASFRLIPAGFAVLAWAAVNGRPQPQGLQAWLSIAAFGLIDGAGFQGFLAQGLQRTSAGLGSIIIDSQPLTVAILAALIYGEQLAGAGYLGLVVGVAGLSLLELPPTVLQDALPAVSNSLNGVGLDASRLLASTPNALASAPEAAATAVDITADGSLWQNGEWWMLLAAQSMALGTIMVQWVTRQTDPVVAVGWHMVLGGLPLAAICAVQESSALLPRLQQLNGHDIAGLLYVSLLGSAASYGVFFYNASRGNLTRLSSLTFLTPMFASACGYLALGETLTPLQLTGATITLGSVALVTNAGKDDR
ncbi:hypothetical protein WJX74_001379 [Apatococcus lobatus]|uniref:superoxide dismutase n=2 Tax=Apatococcus TaxID=904362 RepID=A0AAW1S9C6_9CHLO